VWDKSEETIHVFPMKHAVFCACSFKENLVTADSFRALSRDGRHVMAMAKAIWIPTKVTLSV
jgi:hypothetical protein